jgi:hypothetical protein
VKKKWRKRKKTNNRGTEHKTVVINTGMQKDVWAMREYNKRLKKFFFGGGNRTVFRSLLLGKRRIENSWTGGWQNIRQKDVKIVDIRITEYLA